MKSIIWFLAFAFFGTDAGSFRGDSSQAMDSSNAVQNTPYNFTQFQAEIEKLHRDEFDRFKDHCYICSDRAEVDREAESQLVQDLEEPKLRKKRVSKVIVNEDWNFDHPKDFEQKDEDSHFIDIPQDEEKTEEQIQR